MARKRCHRRMVVPMPPKGLRPKLQADQLTDLGLCHMLLLDDISQGRGTEQTLWDLVGATFTWCRAAELTGQHLPTMAAQLELATRLVERYGRTGRVGFSGPEYQLAKQAVVVMDDLAALVDRPTAMAAADWSESMVNRMAAGQLPVQALQQVRQQMRQAA